MAKTDAARSLVGRLGSMRSARTDFVIDRSNGRPLRLKPDAVEIDMERPGDDLTPHWLLCEVRLACGVIVSGSVRVTPPQDVVGSARITRTTGLIVNVRGQRIDVLNGGERQRVRLSAARTFPACLRFDVAPPNPVTGLHPDHPSLELPVGTWSRPLSPVDIVDDVSRINRW